ncbi:Transcriptional regulator, ArsR family [Myxococcus hansupus]|uniref:Transcriptional regulator, ArsR family n=1 Tax=Pseudomyxococcus hansupus TaxID=1297742 RepID=A0A0H4WQY8_9BACT|nr:metalloregulator ArsR/SmtB family transcription factor [Myxococcus hansupus]AKQ63775.1 Transcriptional regulator, ArsR family [Myxococcus hansupus]
MVSPTIQQRSEQLDAVFHALSDPTRREMLRSLSAGSRSIGELAAPFSMSFAGASKHVKALERAGLVHRTVEGRTHRCSLAPEPLASALDWLRFYERFWNDRLDALEQALRKPERGSSRKGERHE